MTRENIRTPKPQCGRCGSDVAPLHPDRRTGKLKCINRQGCRNRLRRLDVRRRRRL